MRRPVTTLRSKATLSFLALGMTTILPSLANAAPAGIKHFHDPSELQPATVMTPNGASGCKLSNGGGQLISNIQAVPVFWSAKVDAGIQSWAPGYLAALANSTYMDALSEYSSSSQKIGRGTATQGYVITPASTATTGISNTTISNELAKQITAGNLPKPVFDSKGNANTMFIVFFPKGYSLTLQGSKSCASGGFCAYHDNTTYTSKDVAFAAIPDMSSGSGCDKGCQVCPTGDTVCSGSAENVAATSVSHEIAEAVTDMVGNSAWVDQKSACGEIGDICAATSAIDVDTGIVTGSSPPIYAQLEWSNAQNKCEMSNPTIGVQPGGGTTTCTAASCTGATPICDTGSGQCRGCSSDVDCSGTTPHCATSASDAKHGSCVACTVSSQCTSKSAPVCGTTDTCGGCKTNNDCSAFSGTTCDTTSGGCVTSGGGGNDAGNGGGDVDSGNGGGGDVDSGNGGGGGYDAGKGTGGGYDAGKGKDAGKGSGADAGTGDGDTGGGDTGTPSGCSIGRGESSGGAGAFGFAGALFGLAAMVRARRRSARRG